MAEEEIIFSNSDISAREEFFLERIINAKEKIIRECGKCEDGFLIENPDPKDISDLDQQSAKVCSCRARAERAARIITSGIPECYANKKYSKFPIDETAAKQFRILIERFDDLYEKGKSVLFLPVKNNDNLSVARTFCVVNVLLHVLDNPKNYSVFYMTAGNYFKLLRKAVSRDDIRLKNFLDEAESVDLLCIDGLGNSKSTEYGKNSLEELIRSRIHHLRPTFFISGIPEKSLYDFFDSDVIELMVAFTARIIIREFRGHSLTDHLGLM